MAYAVPIGSMKIVLPSAPAPGQLGGLVVPDSRGEEGFEVGAAVQTNGLPHVETCVVTQVVTYLVTLVAAQVPNFGPPDIDKEKDDGVGVGTGLTGTIVLMTVGTKPQVTQIEADAVKVVPLILIVPLEDMEQDEHCVVVVIVPIMTAVDNVSGIPSGRFWILTRDGNTTHNRRSRDGRVDRG